MVLGQLHSLHLEFCMMAKLARAGRLLQHAADERSFLYAGLGEHNQNACARRLSGS